MDLLYRTGMDLQFMANGAVEQAVETTKLNRPVAIGRLSLRRIAKGTRTVQGRSGTLGHTHLCSVQCV